MVMALAGTLYPVPAAPYSWLPYLYFVYLLITLIFFFRTRRKGDEISHDGRFILKTDCNPKVAGDPLRPPTLLL